MTRIAVLPESIASKIAAGEVVERPASVLKELIENAIDAGARTIDVVLEGGGRDTLSVTDDGEGMGPDDLLLALERHATSKIRSDLDIERVTTLGFRGEAIPSIASVCRFRIASRDGASEAATVAEVHGGRLMSVEEEASPRGTRVEVRQLFYNAPARRKFLRAADTERQRSAEVMSRFAIGFPEIRFRLTADGRPVFDHPPSAEPLERCSQVLGRQLAGRLLGIQASQGPLALAGLGSGLGETRAHSRDQHLFVNRRPVRDRLLAHAVSLAYGEALPRGRHPVLVLLLTLPADLVDVNVHPTKSEVRFRRPGEIHDFVAEALRKTLRAAGAAPRLATAWPDTGAGPGPRIEGLDRFGRWERVTAGPSRFPDPLLELRLSEGSRSAEAPWWPSEGGSTGSVSETARHASPLPQEESWAGAADPSASASLSYGTLEPPEHPAGTPRVAVLGQFLASYIVASEGGDLLVVDQHAAHERVLFERIQGRHERGGEPVQGLLSPVTVELAPAERGTARRFLEPLQAAGFAVEAFGEEALLLRGLPAGLDPVDPERLLRDVLSDLREERSAGAPQEMRRRVSASTACHAAIKVRSPLTHEKMAWLLRVLFACETPTTCPHGRPAVLRMGLDAIERGFHRR